ncbi:TetR/AcrR family transcriptional regulator [Blastococcus sp. Marseille-P5729]|uniref:TetR/AcrR family transcriptional regulator n=1 Tax=Blastococcus sp. Marseille-P5729 TaxID=2086582 RepID=UPI0018FED16E|nr:TetR/AcrR family transcriptional regulator [Blastococcus sp. Marseille-P5729]
MSRSDAKAYHHGDLAATLERAAIALLGEKSASSLSLREVARKAGVSHNAPYHHFGDRQGLLKAVAARSLRDLFDAMMAARDAVTAPRERLLGAGQAYVQFAVEHPGQFDAIFDPEICDPREPNPVTAPFIEANDKLLRDAVSAALPAASDQQVEATASALWGTVHGLALLVSTGHLPIEVVRPGLESVLDLQI